jgi:hypothetical protein
MYLVFPDDWRGIERSPVYPLSESISSTTVCRQFYAEVSPLIPRLNEFCFISKIVVKTTLVNFGYSLHEREVLEKMFLGVLRKRGFGC